MHLLVQYNVLQMFRIVSGEPFDSYSDTCTHHKG